MLSAIAALVVRSPFGGVKGDRSYRWGRRAIGFVGGVGGDLLSVG
jgi:hypothetical protein